MILTTEWGQRGRWASWQMGVGGEPWKMAGICKAEKARVFQDGQLEHRAESGPGHRARDVGAGSGAGLSPSTQQWGAEMAGGSQLLGPGARRRTFALSPGVMGSEGTTEQGTGCLP